MIVSKNSYKNISLENLKQVAKDVVLFIKNKEESINKKTKIKSESNERNDNKSINNSFVIYLEGVMGAGKTSFAKALAAELGIKSDVQSPTFTLMREYEIYIKKYTHLLHIDAYRFEKKEEGNILNLKSRLKENNIILIEWPQNMNAPKADMIIKIEKIENSEDLRNIWLII